MKIICVGRNYVAHAKELNNEVPDKPVIFLKPDTALLKENKPFYLPEWSDDIHYEAEVVLRINRNGKYIDEKFANKYVDELTLGVDFTARDLQTELKNKGLPWELAKAFDNSAVVGQFLKLTDLQQQDPVRFHMEKNGETVQQADTSLMLFPWYRLIAFVSRFISLRAGDLLFTGTPQGVGKVVVGDEYKGYIEDRKVFDFKVK